MQYKSAWYALIVVAIVLIIFELFFRYRYVHAGGQLWRIDRVTEQACLVRIGDAMCSPSTVPVGAPGAGRRSANRNPYLVSPTPEPNPR
jgi:hypothetical protein